MCVGGGGEIPSLGEGEVGSRAWEDAREAIPGVGRVGRWWQKVV